jgi:hypothetical protein
VPVSTATAASFASSSIPKQVGADAKDAWFQRVKRRPQARHGTRRQQRRGHGTAMRLAQQVTARRVHLIPPQGQGIIHGCPAA